jgi:hypothetical protein
MKTKILALAVVACFLLSIVPAFAAGEKVTMAQRLEQLREKLQDARDKYLKQKEAFNDARTKWLEVKDKFASAIDNVTLDRTRDYFNSSSTYLVRYLGVVEKKVTESPYLSDDKKTELTAELDGYITTLQKDHDSIVAASGKQDIRAAVNQTKTDWDAIRPQVKRIIGEVMAARVQIAIDKEQNLSMKIDAKITELKAAGKDTTKLEQVNADFKTNLAKAQSDEDALNAKLAEVKTSGNAAGVLIEADALLREVSKDLVQAYRGLASAYREMNMIGTNSTVTTNVSEVTELNATPLTGEGS